MPGSEGRLPPGKCHKIDAKIATAIGNISTLYAYILPGKYCLLEYA